MLDVSLVVIGFIIVAISYFISEKIEDGKGLSEGSEALGQGREIWSKKDEKRVTEQIEAITARKMEEAEEQADDELSKLSNEKIMAVDEFSNQILEKIEKNHKDVVFLYNMLNEKQEEIKKMITEADLTKTALEDSIRISQENNPKAYTAVDMLQKIAKEGKDKSEIHEKLGEKEKEALSAIFKESEQKEEAGKEVILTDNFVKEQGKSTILETQNTDTEEIEQDMSTANAAENIGDELNSIEEAEKPETEVPNTKEQILELYKEGKNILEISRLLNMGQGEVKLIIDLYQ